jgi:hypothetical protein
MSYWILPSLLIAAGIAIFLLPRVFAYSAAVLLIAVGALGLAQPKLPYLNRTAEGQWRVDWPKAQKDLRRQIHKSHLQIFHTPQRPQSAH